MAGIRKSLLGLAVMLLLGVAAAGCGGGGDDDSINDVTATATVPDTAPSVTETKPVSTTPNDGFTEAQWKAYQADAAKFKALNTSTLDKVSVCAKPANQTATGLQKCVGDSLDNLAAATKELGATLAGFANSVGGECQQALGALINYVVPYQASVASLQNTITTANAAAVYNSVSSLKIARANGQKAAANVEKTCAP